MVERFWRFTSVLSYTNAGVLMRMITLHRALSIPSVLFRFCPGSAGHLHHDAGRSVRAVQVLFKFRSGSGSSVQVPFRLRT